MREMTFPTAGAATHPPPEKLDVADVPEGSSKMINTRYFGVSIGKTPTKDDNNAWRR